MLAFSFTGSVIPAGEGTLVDLGGDCSASSSLTGFIFADALGGSLDVEFSDGPALPTVSIISPADGSSFDDVTSVAVEASCSDCSEGDHYHGYLDDIYLGMFYTDTFSINVGFGDHTLMLTIADSGHQ